MQLIGSGFLDRNQFEVYQVRLKANTTYRIYVKVDEINVDFDVYVMDENKNIVAVDETNAADATCLITPAWSGLFAIGVKSARGSSGYKLYIG